MVKFNLALVALVALGPAFSIASPTGVQARDPFEADVEVQDSPLDHELFTRDDRQFRCDYGGSMASVSLGFIPCVRRARFIN